MKPEASVIEVEGTLPGEKIDMSFDVSALGHLMSVMSGLYSNQELAVIREYSTNARDAMIDAGKGDLPIEITLPSRLAPHLRIKDQGIGMGIEDIREIYSKYGASTKRDSDDVVGMLGLGCKSALAYGDSFTLSAVKDGNKIEVAIAVGDEVPTMTVVDEYATDEPNGVEVIIPVTGYNTFEHEARDFFYYWQKGTVLVNGEEPASIYDDPKIFWIADDIAITPNQSEDKVVMGNVAYPMEAKHEYSRRYSVVAFVPIGAVNFVPSREALKFNTKTTTTIETYMTRIEAEASKAIEKQVEGADSKPEALAIYTKFASIFRGKFTVEAVYKGKEIPADMSSPLVGATAQAFVVVKSTEHKGYREKGWHRMDKVPSSVWSQTIFVRGYDGADFSPYKRKKMDQWIEEVGNVPEHNQVVFTSSVPNHHWIEKGRIFNWQAIKDQKIVRETVKKQDGRVSGSYEGYVDGVYKHQILADEIDTNNPVVYCEKNYGYSSQAWDIVRKEYAEHTFVTIGSNRVSKFTRDFPTAKTINEAAKEIALKWEKSLTDDDKLHIHIMNNDSTGYRTMGLNALKPIVDDLEDPDLVKAIEQIKSKKGMLLAKYQTYSSFISLKVDWVNPMENYPLLQTMSVYGTMSEMQQQHITLYLNAAYAAGQEAS
jgi:hypothetical protein